MRTLHVTLLAATVFAGCIGKNDLSDPKTPFEAMSGYATYQGVSGDLQGSRPDPITGMPSPAGVPYTETVVDFGVEWEGLPGEQKEEDTRNGPSYSGATDGEHTVLGTSMGMVFGMHMGYVRDREIEPASGMVAGEEFLPLTMGISAVSTLPVLRRPGLVVMLHTGLRVGYEPERLGDTAESLLVVHGGARAYFDKGPARVRVVYDFSPFWSGESRLEHKLSGVIGKTPGDGWGYGVRAAATLGQNRLREGGLNDASFTLGIEVQK